MNNKKIMYKIYAAGLAIFTAVALFADVESTGNLSVAMNGAGIAQLLTVILCIWGYYNCLPGHALDVTADFGMEKIVYGIIALLFSLFMIVGKAQVAKESLKFSVFAIILLIGYFPFFYVLVRGLITWLRKQDGLFDRRDGGRITLWLFERHPMLGTMLCVYLCRLPYWIAFFPCSMTWDGGIQISNFYGLENFTNHHPPMLSFFYGGIAWYSNLWGHAQMGMFLITLIQTSLTAFAVGRTCCLLRKLQTAYWIRWMALGYYCLFTVWCIFDCTVIKDTLYHPLTLLFTIQIIECIYDTEGFFRKKSNLFLLILYAVLMTQVRNNGIFVLVFVAPFMILLVHGKRRAVMSGAVIAGLVVIMFLNNYLWPSLGVVSLEDKVDTYCIMFQQTAKYAQKHPDDVTEQERAVLNEVFDYDELPKVYNPQLADWGKNCLRVQEGSAEDPTGSAFAGLKKEYFKVWFSQLKRHPLTYVEAFLECSYGYYYPEVRPYKEEMGFYEYEAYTFNSSMSDAHQLDSMAFARFILAQLSKLEYVPGIGLLYRCGFYTWLMILGTGILILQKRYRIMISTIPAWVNVLVCLISPVNSCIRYVMPTMCFIPVLIALVCRKERSYY